MKLKELTNIPAHEIMKKLVEAQKQNIEHLDLGGLKLRIPALKFDPILMS